MTVIEEILSKIARMRAVRKRTMRPSNAMQDLQSSLAQMAINQRATGASRSQDGPLAEQADQQQTLSWKEMQYEILGLNHLLSLISDDLSGLSAKTFVDVLQSERRDGMEAQNNMERNRLEQNVTANLEHATKILQYIFSTSIPRSEHIISLEALRDSIIKKAEDLVFVLQRYQEAVWVVRTYEATQATDECETSRSVNRLPEIEGDSTLRSQLEDMRL